MTDRAVITSPCVGGESLRRRRSWDYWRFYGGETALQSRHGSPCSALLRVDDGSDWSFENKRSGAIHDWRGRICSEFCTRLLEEEAFKNNQEIEI